MGTVALYTYLIVSLVTCPILCILKGKGGFAALGFFVCGVFSLVGACRLARPGSVWYRKWYSEEKMTRSRERFGV